MRTIKRKIVAAIIISQDGKIFQGMKHPKKGGVYVDCWHIPGGGVDGEETEKQALIREIKEETGLDISSKKITLVDKEGKGSSEKIIKETGEKVLCEMEFSVYKVEMDEMTEKIKINLGDDLEKFSWTPISELKKIKLTPPSEELFKRLGYI